MNLTPSRFAARRTALGALLMCCALGACSTIQKYNPFSKKDPEQAAATAAKPGMEIGYSAGRATQVSDLDASRVTQFVSQAQYGYVRLERIEDGAPPNEHPFSITGAQLKTMLATIKDGKDNDPVFNDDELAEIAGPLSTALSRAKPTEDITFAVSGKHSAFGLFAARTVTTGRVFVKNRSLNIIFGELHGEFENQFLATGWLRPFTAGSRAQSSRKAVLATGVGMTAGASGRQDWLVLSEAAVPPPPGAARAATGAPLSATPAPDAYYQDIEKRLTVLKGLKDKGLITEQEFDEKRKEILKNL